MVGRGFNRVVCKIAFCLVLLLLLLGIGTQLGWLPQQEGVLEEPVYFHWKEPWSWFVIQLVGLYFLYRGCFSPASTPAGDPSTAETGDPENLG